MMTIIQVLVYSFSTIAVSSLFRQLVHPHVQVHTLPTHSPHVPVRFCHGAEAHTLLLGSLHEYRSHRYPAKKSGHEDTL